MGVTLNIHKTHRQYTDGQDTVTVEGDTIGRCLNALVKRFPDMREILFSGPEKLSNQVEIYLNAESAYPDELKKSVHSGDQIHITIMLMGG